MRFVLPVFVFLLLSGCVATTTDVDRLNDSIDRLDKDQQRIQKSQADLISKMDELDHTLVTLQASLDESRKKMSTLSEKLDDTQQRLVGRLETISQLLSAATTQASVPVPSDLFRTAETDYNAGRTVLAIEGFKDFLARYPQSDLADQAQLLLGNCYLILKDYVQAINEYDKTVKTSRRLGATALLKRSYCLKGLSSEEGEKSTLQYLIKNYPDSTEAQNAKQILQDLEKKENAADQGTGEKAPREEVPKKQ